MHEISQFKTTLYVVVLLGLAAFGVAAHALGFWAICSAAVILHAWLSSRGKFRPLSRMYANLITIGALLYVIREYSVDDQTTPVLIVGQFLALLQIVKLWELRTNRDYVQLLVVGLLLMVSASISTPSLLYCILLAVWLIVALYCCLLFHLKAESDRARIVLGIAPEKYDADTLLDDQRELPRSVRRLTFCAATVGMVFAVVVFLFFPRVNGAGFFGQFQVKAAQALVGFSEEVSFQNVAKLQENNEPIAYVSLTHNGQPVNGTYPLILRGTTLDRYAGKQAPLTRRYHWIRSLLPTDRGNPNFLTSREVRVSGPMLISFRVDQRRFRRSRVEQPEAPEKPQNDKWIQDITLRPTGTSALFSMAGVQKMRSVNHNMRVRYYFDDATIEASDPNRISDNLEYQVQATGELPQQDPTLLPTQEMVSGRIKSIDPQVLQLAMQPEVSGSSPQGALSALRATALQKDSTGAVIPVSKFDEKIADNIQHYLRTHYVYDLDLTDTRKIEGRDPIVAFLYDFKRGHCEYFAGAMTLMCQSLGMQARMVVGFQCDPDSFVNGYYVVKQSHAHAWVEVLTTDGTNYTWKSFDPTSGTETASAHASLFKRLQTYWDYLDFSYAKAVVAFDNKTQGTLFGTMQRWLGHATDSIHSVTAFLRRIHEQGEGKWLAGWMSNAENANVFWTICKRVFVGLMVFCLFGSLAWFSIERIRLRRRAERIGIMALPMSEKLRLAKQLGFYDELLLVLGRKRIVRKPHQTPMEFSRSLLFLPAQSYETIIRLTELFYRIRYGRAVLTPARRRHLATVLANLNTDLGSVHS